MLVREFRKRLWAKSELSRSQPSLELTPFAVRSGRDVDDLDGVVRRGAALEGGRVTKPP
jgi:hypothetical protein